MSFHVYPAYKDSGVEWQGAVPADWPRSALKYLADYQNGYPFKPEDWSEKGLPIIRISQLTGDTEPNYYSGELDDRVKVNDGDLLFSWSATIDSFIWAGGTAWLNQHIFKVSLTEEADQQFLFYLIKLVAPKLADFDAHGSTMRHIKKESLSERLHVPTLKEQTQIARFLDHETARIDALIEEQQRLIELLKEKRQAVISHAVTKGLDPMVPMKNSGVEWLGEVPAHWVVSRAKLVSDIFVPQRNKPELNDSEGIAWVTMEDMNGGYISATNLKVTELAADEAGSKVLKKGAVIASCVGRFGIVAINAVDVVINQQLQAFEPREIKAEYLKNIVSLSKEYFELIGTAATLVYVNQQGFENLPVLIPSVSEQESICLYVDEANARFDALLSQSFESIQLLQERRSALISAAVTGKIDVRGWQPPASAPTPELVEEAV